jgi:CBS domain-containing protein
VKTIDADTSILELAELFLKSPYRRYPVMDDNRLVGQISRRDVLRAMEKLS